VIESFFLSLTRSKEKPHKIGFSLCESKPAVFIPDFDKMQFVAGDGIPVSDH
jgi:hypothetical protein